MHSKNNVLAQQKHVFEHLFSLFYANYEIEIHRPISKVNKTILQQLHFLGKSINAKT